MKNLFLVLVLFFSLSANAQNLGLYVTGATEAKNFGGFDDYAFGALGEVSFNTGNIVLGLDYGILSLGQDASVVPVRVRGDYLFNDFLFAGVGFGVDHYNVSNVESTSFSLDPSLGLVASTKSDFDFVFRVSYGVESSQLPNRIKFNLGIRTK